MIKFKDILNELENQLNNNKNITKMTLDEQIKYTEDELKAYKSSRFSSPIIIGWLESVLESLYQLKKII